MNLKYSDKDFLWGAATSSFQIEGGIKNDIYDWEKEGRFKNNGYNPQIKNATDHWNLWKSDFKILKELGLNSYRFSLEWARIEPQPGVFNQEAIDQYRIMVDKLLEYNITPMMTLHHFTHPGWFHQRSPWHHSRSVESFLRFSEHIIPYFSETVPLIVTINEPLVWLLAAYGDAKFPPGFKDYDKMMAALFNMLTAHKEVYDMIKDLNKDIQIGIAHNFINFKRAPHGTFFDKKLKRLIHYFYNKMIIRAFEKNQLKLAFPFLIDYNEPIDLDKKIDFWGINYYYRLHVKFKFDFKQPFELLSLKRSSGKGQSDLGWEIYPKGLLKVFNWLKATGKPLYVTENGIAVENDELRRQFIEDHLNVVDQAINDGIDIKGYYHWSLLDNYEWLIGNKARFGLVDVDYSDSYKRTIKDSARFYKEYISS